MMHRLVAAVLLGGLSACANPSGPRDVPTAAPAAPEPTLPREAVVASGQSAQARLEGVERALTREAVRLRFDVTSAGVLESRMVGVLEMDGDRVELEARGTFAGQAVELLFDADGTRMRGRGGARAFELSQPAGLREAIAVGMVRMGILHTLAVLAAGAPPDHAQGGVRDWLTLSVLPDAPTVAVMEPLHEVLPSDPLTFDVRVDGEPAVHATLWVEDGLPRERQQLTRFAQGEMTVREAFDPA